MALTEYQRQHVALEAELGFQLHPTGSEYFGYEGGDDFDFLVSVLDVPDVMQRLVVAGFREQMPDGYDPDPEEWINFRRGKVDIEVVMKETSASVAERQLTLVKIFGVKEFGKFCKRDRRRLYYITRQREWKG